MASEHRVVMLAVLLALHVGPVAAHDDKHDAKAVPKSAVMAEQKTFGIAGEPKKVSRTVTMDMSDEMRFHPSVLRAKRGETVRFVLVNKGKVLHEMVIGTMAELKEHAALMKKFPEMEHEEPYMAHVKPGTSESIVWRFNRVGEFNFACLIAGHFEAGMVGRIIVN